MSVIICSKQSSICKIKEKKDRLECFDFWQCKIDEKSRLMKLLGDNEA
jgi:hypothetical protein